jgi:hypothetical protein
MTSELQAEVIHGSRVSTLGREVTAVACNIRAREPAVFPATRRRHRRPVELLVANAWCAM